MDDDARRARSVTPIRFEVSALIDAPSELVAGLYRDVSRWPEIFPTIRSVRLVENEGASQLVEVDHVTEGPILNRLSSPRPDLVVLREWKRRYDATFSNRFESFGGATRMTVSAAIELKGIARLLRPFVRGRAERLVRMYQIEPIRRAAEGHVNRGHR